MSRRGRGRGDWPTIDDVSGFRISGRHDAVIQWDGLLRHRREVEFRHPQDFAKALNDPTPIPNARTRPVERYCPNPFSVVPQPAIGEWTIGTHWLNYRRTNIYDGFLKPQEPGVGDMEVECTLYVYPDPQVAPAAIAPIEPVEFALLTESGDQLVTESGIVLVAEFTANTGDTLSTEDGDELVTESGDLIVAE